MKAEVLRGWDVSVEMTTIQEPQSDDGPMVDAPGWTIVFEEVVPRTGNSIRWTCGRAVRDSLVRQLTGGILPATEMPKVDGPII